MQNVLRRISLTWWILIGMGAGVLVGVLSPATALQLQPVSSIFLRLIKSIIVPILFSTLVIGIAGHGDDLKRVGRLAVKSIIYFEVVTTLALAVGLLAVNIVKPGEGVTLTTAAPVSEASELASKGTEITVANFAEHLVPQSFAEAATHNDVLPVVIWSLLFAVALSQVRGRPRDAVLQFCEGLAEVMFKFTAIVMRFAPVGIMAAMAVTVGHSGWHVLVSLAKLVGTLYGALFVFFVLVLLPVAVITRVPIRKFLQAIKQPALIAFSTTSSEAALPRAMQGMEAIGVPRRIVSFVMPLGYSFNLDGSTLYLSLASVFVAQAAGIHLSIGTQLLMMLTLMLTSKGVAAVPRASLVILAGTLASFNLPLAGVLVILGVDTLMDMARTTTNLIGNCLATVVMARWEGEFDPDAPILPPEESARDMGLSAAEPGPEPVAS